MPRIWSRHVPLEWPYTASEHTAYRNLGQLGRPPGDISLRRPVPSHVFPRPEEVRQECPTTHGERYDTRLEVTTPVVTTGARRRAEQVSHDFIRIRRYEIEGSLYGEIREYLKHRHEAIKVILHALAL